MSLDKKENREEKFLFSKVKRNQSNRCRIYKAESCRSVLAFALD